MENYWNNIKDWLTEEERLELSFFIGAVELGRDTSDINVKRIVMVAYNAYLMCQEEYTW